MSFFQELKQRNVFRVAITYILAAWILLQIADVVLGNIMAPEWVFKALLLLLALGFPLVLIFAWAFELTPEGIKREKEVDRSQSITSETGRKLNAIVIVLLVAAVAVLLVERKYKSDETTPAVAVSAKPAKAIEPAVSSVADSESNSIAVLPFVNMSSDPEQDYFSDGISEELLNLLAKIPDFRVAGRTSSFAFKGKNDDLRHIGESLGVANILEGSVRKAGDSVRITAQLVKVDDGFHLWSETYDRELTNIFTVQDEIAGAVVSQLKLTLLGDDGVIDPMRKNPAAHDAYLQGLAEFNLRGPENYAKAAAFAEQAVKLEPQSALSWALLAKANVWVAAQGSGTDISQGVTRARMAISRAMALNDKLPEAFAAKALIQYMFDWDWRGALESTERALELRPADVESRMVKKDILEILGRLDEAVVVLEDALTLDPNNRRVRSSIAALNSVMRKHKLAETQRRQVIADFSGEYLAGDRVSLGWDLYGQGRYAEALPLLEAEPISFLRLQGLAIVNHKLGKFDEARAAQQELLAAYGDAASYQQASVFAEWGEPDTAMDWLNTAYTVRDPGLSSLLTDYSLDPLRDRPDFKALLKKMNLAN